MFNAGRRHDRNVASSEHPCHAGAVLEKALPVSQWAAPPEPAVGYELQDFPQVNGRVSLFASQVGVRQVLEITGMCLGCNTLGTRPSYKEHTPFPWYERVRGGSDCAPGRRHGTSGTMVRQVWKNNGSAVETEPYGEA